MRRAKPVSCGQKFDISKNSSLLTVSFSITFRARILQILNVAVQVASSSFRGLFCDEA